MQAAVKRLPISSWSIEDRPTDKMIELGVNALSDAELYWCRNPQGYCR